MKQTIFAVFGLSIAVAGVANAQTASPNATSGAHLTQAQLKQMARDAHTPEQYSSLAGYYTAQQKSYLAQAAEEKLEWIRRSQNVMLVAAKYPRPVDSARYLYDYDLYMAAESGQLATKYGALATPEPAATAK